SLRVRGLLERVLARPGYIGILAFTLPEALWLVAHGAGDVVVAYPTAERGALRRLATRPEALDAITLMVDETAQLDLVLDAVADLGPRADGRRIRVALELDVSFTPLPGVRFGALRSPLHTPAEAVALAREVLARPGLELVGMMAYAGQIPGGPDAARTPYRPARPRAGGDDGLRGPDRGGHRCGPHPLRRGGARHEAPVPPRRRRASRRGGGRGAGDRRPRVRQRRRHRLDRVHHRGGRSHRGRGRLRTDRPRALRPLSGLHPAPRPAAGSRRG